MKRFRHYLTYNGAVKELLRSPAGWRDSKRNFYRHNLYNSVFREDATEIRLVNFGELFDYGAYWWLKNLIDNNSPNIEVKYTRQRLNPYTKSYEPDYEGVLDLTPKSGYKEDKNYITVKTIDSSKLAKFVSRDDINLNILSTESIDGVSISPFVSAPNVIEVPKIDIYLNTITTGSFAGAIAENDSDNVTRLLNYNGTAIDDEIGNRLQLNDPAVDNIVYNNSLPYSSDFYVKSISGTYNLSYLIDDLNPSDEWTITAFYRLRSYDSGDILQQTETSQIVNFSGSGNVEDNLVQPYDTSVQAVSVPEGGYVTFELVTNITSTNALMDISFGIATVQVEATFVELTEGAESSNVNGLFIHELMTRQIQLVTSETDKTKLFKSKIAGRTNSEFTTYPSNGNISRLWLTSGQQLRGKDNPIYTTIQETFTSINAMHPVGLGYDKVNDVFVLEDISEFYKDQPFTFTLDNVEVSKEFIDEYYWNKCVNGYPKVELEDFQGANEYNTQSEHSSVFKTKSTYNIRSVYQGSSIDVEGLRRLGNTSKDDNNDDKNYILLTDGLKVVQNGSSYSGFDGIEQYFNPGYTPRQNVIKHTKLLSAEFHNLPSEKIRFQSNIKNQNITYSGVNEFDDIQSSEFLTPLIYPEKYSFEAFVTYEFIEELRLDPHKYLIFSDGDNNEYYGYIMNLAFNVYTKKATFELIRANINR